MTSLILIISALILAAVPNPKPVIPAGAANCALEQPPKGSGEDFTNGLEARIYPRRAALSGHYTGCQILWAGSSGHWVKLSSTYIENSLATAHEDYDEHGAVATSCRYDGKLLIQGPAERCPGSDGLILHSLPPGCVSRIRANYDAGALPKGCEYDLRQRAR